MLKKTLLYTFAFIFTSAIFCDISITEQSEGILLHTEYGSYQVTEPVLCELITCKGLERLKLIHQYGVTHYGNASDWFNRYDHSLGVFVLLRHFGAPLDEQIAGLLHDVSHTVFSHVGDFVFDTYFNRYSHQDDVHEWCLEKLGVMKILKKYGYQNCCSPQAKKNQLMFEQDRPDICADRIEYLLRGGLVDKILTQDDVTAIVEDLYFEDGNWIFAHQAHAKKLAMAALWLSEHVFGTAWNVFIYTHAANALKHAVEINLLSLDDIHFSTDDIVWHKMLNHGDDFIKESLDKVMHYQNYFDVSDEHNYDLHLRSKCLAIDPWVKVENGIMRLSTVDTAYAFEYNRINELINRGWYVKIH